METIENCNINMRLRGSRPIIQVGRVS